MSGRFPLSSVGGEEGLGSPKTESRRPKSEDRNPRPRAVRICFGLQPSGFRLPSAFDLRISAFFRPSTFGLRVSACFRPSTFGLRVSACFRLRPNRAVKPLRVAAHDILEHPPPIGSRHIGRIVLPERRHQPGAGLHHILGIGRPREGHRHRPVSIVLNPRNRASPGKYYSGLTGGWIECGITAGGMQATHRVCRGR